jgi:hypothetical protein
MSITKYLITFSLLIFSVKGFSSTIKDSLTYKDSVKVSDIKSNAEESYLGENTFYSTPVYTFNTKKKGPIIVVHGGMHGDEIAGTIACDRLINILNIKNGTLVLIPRINRPASEQNLRSYNGQPDRDFNSYFPGKDFSYYEYLKSNYEYSLAQEFISYLKEIKPDVVINLHEDKDKYPTREDVDTSYDVQETFGQSIYTVERPISDTLKQFIKNLNSEITYPQYKMTINSVIDPDAIVRGNLLEYIADSLKPGGKNIRSYTLETYRNQSVGGRRRLYRYGFELEDRVKMQMLVILNFLDIYGMKYDLLPDNSIREELRNLTQPVR